MPGQWWALRKQWTRWCSPTTVKGLQIFPGLINFYPWFLSGIAAILLSLTDALKGSKLPNKQLEWTGAMEISFQRAKDSLKKATWLAHPDPQARLALHMEASATHVGGSQQQSRVQSTEWPLGFFSASLSRLRTSRLHLTESCLHVRDSISRFWFI